MNADGTVRLRGFTLIEVLVALAVVALGLIGVFGQMSQSATAASRLRDKTLADWIAVNAVTELRLSGAFPAVGTTSKDVGMANMKWHYEMKVSETDGGLRRADVIVSFADSPDRPVAMAAGFVTQRPPSSAAAASPGWPACGVETVPGSDVSPPPGPSPAPPATSDEDEQ